MTLIKNLINPKRTATTLLTAAAISVGTALSTTAPAIAANFVLQDDPRSEIDGSATTPDNFGNSRNLNGLSLVNTGDRTADLSFVVSNTWTFVGGTLVGLAWDNHKDGWFNADVDGTSLLVTLTNTSDRIRLGDIADLTGESAFPLTQPCDDNPSCYVSPFPFPIEDVTQSPDDELPIFNLGTFAAGESKSFDQSFLFTYGDNREGSTPLLSYGFTAASVPEDVPEPASAAAIVLMGAVLLKGKKRFAQG